MNKFNDLAIISGFGKYRYWLRRDLGIADKGMCLFVMCNPSTADATEDDATIRRCMNFARSWGYQSLGVLNLFAYRATKVKDMKAADDPIGPENNQILVDAIPALVQEDGIVVVAWGNDGMHLNRHEDFLALFHKAPLYCLEINKATGQPKHPLYCKSSLKPVPYP